MMSTTRNRRFGAKVVGAVLAALAVASFSGLVKAGISYSTMNDLYTENFNSAAYFPTTLPFNANIQTHASGLFTDGWQNDVDPTLTAENDIGAPGWYLYHQSAQTEGGFGPPANHSRVRVGAGTQTTGAFMLFSSAASDTERALGAVGATTLVGVGGNIYMGLRLTNDTGQTLNQFTITYDGELWRRGASSETLFFEYSTTATADNWRASTAGLFTAGTEANFITPAASAGAVDGNAAGLVADITGTFTGFDWLPGEELWLRWRDPQVSGANDGIAIDNVRFFANNAGTGGGPINILSIASGLASSGATWDDDNNPPEAGKSYRIVATHTVTLNEDFAGDILTVGNGGALDISATGLDVRRLVVQAGGTLNESVSGSFQLGKLGLTSDPLGVLELQQDVNFTVGAGEVFTIGMNVEGTGDMDIETGAGSTVQLAGSVGHQGAIRFNGEGDVFLLGWNRDFRRVEMNSTGENKFLLMHQGERGQEAQGDLTFNEAGTLAHETTTTSPNSRLAVLGRLTANANVEVKLDASYDIGGSNSERRLQFLLGLQGSSGVHVVGMDFDPTDVDGGRLLNAFEIGSQSTEPVNLPDDSYSGTLSAEGFVSLKIRRSMSGARIEIGENARMDTGYNTANSTKVFAFGEIAVDAGGTLEVGFYNEKSGGSGGTGHLVGQIALVADGGRSGDLTLSSGSKTVMQVNGLDAGQFDTIVAEGDITLGGTLELWVNPVSTNATANPTFTPQLNDEWVIMTLAGGASLPTDFDDSTVVDGGDLNVWEGAFGSTAAGDADGDGDSDGADFLAWQRTVGQSSTPSGVITGNFIDVVAPIETPWDAGLDFETVVVGNEVILRVISVSAIAPVPEPSTIALVGVAALGLLAVRRKRANT